MLLLDEYEKNEMYEECKIIKDALDDYFEAYGQSLAKDVMLPTNMAMYLSEKNQDMLKKYNINIDEAVARENAIKIKKELKSF